MKEHLGLEDYLCVVLRVKKKKYTALRNYPEKDIYGLMLKVEIDELQLILAELNNSKKNIRQGKAHG